MAGLGRVEQAKQRSDEKRAAGSRKFLTIEDGETVILRFLEEGPDFKDAYVHRVPFEREDGSTYYSDVPCLDQNNKGTPCPGCRDDVQLRYKFYVNVIVRDYPKTNDAGKVIGEEDQLMIWTGGVTIADKMGKKHKKYGLMSRDWEITREGVKKKTSYDIEQATDGAEPLSKDDQKLVKEKHDLTFYVTPPEFEEFYTPPGQRGKDDEDEEKSGSRRSGTKANPWDRKKTSSKSRSMRTKSRSSRSTKSDGDDSSGTKRRVRSGKSSSKQGTTRVRRRR